MRDEYPKVAFLSPAEVRLLMGFKDAKEWAAFLADNPTFPPLVAVGKTAGGKPRLRYSKERVYAFITHLGG